MPTEHEFKFVLSLDIEKNPTIHSHATDIFEIKQGYLSSKKGMSVRVRKTKSEFENFKNRSSWVLTMKRKVKTRVIEIEKKLSKRDGQELWDFCAGKITKKRHVFHVDGLKWELDLFYSKEKIYFALIEVELPEGTPQPKQIPSFLQGWMIRPVALDDDRFANKNLGDVKYATELLKTVRKGG